MFSNRGVVIKKWASEKISVENEKYNVKIEANNVVKANFPV